MGKMTCDTGRTTISLSTVDRIIFALLVLAGVEAALYWADYWFLGGHRKNILLFVILSYAVFRGVFRSVVSWIFFQFISLPKAGGSYRGYTVDVLTTAMPGEPYEMFEKTLRAMRDITHPHTSYLLDGGNDPALKALCAETGTVHLNCKGVPDAKAGKINHCLNTAATGQFVLVLDPDHIPEPDFLDRTLPCFADPKVGFVQVVQAYYNQNTNVVARAAAEQTFGFYGPLQMGLDGLNMAIAIGANCTFRRTALDAIGGHAVHLAEDCCTSMRIHAAGWKGRYVPYRASYGLVPEDLQTFFKQQIKWSKGMFDLLLHEYPRLFGRFNIQQKIYYLFAGTFFLGGAVNFMTILLPILFLFLQVYAIEMPVAGYLLHVTPYLLVSFALSTYIQRWYSDKTEHGFPWRSMFLEKGTWHIYALGLFYSLTGKTVAWLPTSKTGAGKTGIGLLMPHIIAVILSLAAIIYPFFGYHRLDNGTALMMVFAGMNIVTLLPVIFWGIAARRNAS